MNMSNIEVKPTRQPEVNREVELLCNTVEQLETSSTLLSDRLVYVLRNEPIPEKSLDDTIESSVPLANELSKIRNRIENIVRQQDDCINRLEV